MKLLAGNANLPLAERIAEQLHTPLTQAVIQRFADSEVHVEIRDNVRGEDVFVIQSTSPPSSPTSATRGRTGRRGHGRRSLPSWSRTSSRRPAPTAC